MAEMDFHFSGLLISIMDVRNGFSIGKLVEFKIYRLIKVFWIHT